MIPGGSKCTSSLLRNRSASVLGATGGKGRSIRHQTLLGDRILHRLERGESIRVAFSARSPLPTPRERSARFRSRHRRPEHLRPNRPATAYDSAAEPPRAGGSGGPAPPSPPRENRGLATHKAAANYARSNNHHAGCVQAF